MKFIVACFVTFLFAVSCTPSNQLFKPALTANEQCQTMGEKRLKRVTKRVNKRSRKNRLKDTGPKYTEAEWQQKADRVFQKQYKKVQKSLKNVDPENECPEKIMNIRKRKSRKSAS